MMADNNYMPPAEEVSRCEGARVLPCRHRAGVSARKYCFDGGVADSSGAFVDQSMLHERPCDVGGGYDCECKTDPAVAIYIGFLLPEWGNCLTDGLKKLWYLNTGEGRRLLDEGAKVVFVTLHNTPLPAYQRELWRLAGFCSDDWEQVATPTKYREVVVPGNSLTAYPNGTRTCNRRFEDIISAIRRNALAETALPTDAPRQLYLTRRQLKGSKDSNEKEIERLFQSRGYTVIAPERLPVSEQIALLANADCVAATEGSVSHTAMFMRANANLVILKKAEYANGYQLLAERLSNANVTRISAHHSIRASKAMPWAGPFYLTITPELARWAGVRPPSLPYCLRPTFWLYCLRSLNVARRLRDSLYILYVKAFRGGRFE